MAKEQVRDTFRAPGDSRWRGTSPRRIRLQRIARRRGRERCNGWPRRLSGSRQSRRVPMSCRPTPRAPAFDAAALISTDPPYYDNVGYADLSDFFYVWLRRSLLTFTLISSARCSSRKLRNLSRTLIGTTVKRARGVLRGWLPSRVGSRPRGVRRPSDHHLLRLQAIRAGEDGTTSTGWETLLDGMIRSGWASLHVAHAQRAGQSHDRTARTRSPLDRPRAASAPGEAPTTDRRGLIAALHDELPDALRKLQQGAIAPLTCRRRRSARDGGFSRYAKVSRTTARR